MPKQTGLYYDVRAGNAKQSAQPKTETTAWGRESKSSAVGL